MEEWKGKNVLVFFIIKIKTKGKWYRFLFSVCTSRQKVGQMLRILKILCIIHKNFPLNFIVQAYGCVLYISVFIHK